jgi:hypothetical protein
MIDKKTTLLTQAAGLGFNTSILTLKRKLEARHINAKKIEADKRAADTIKARLQRKQDEEARREADDKRIRKAQLDAMMPEIKEEVARFKSEQKDKELRREEKERKRKIEAKEFNSLQQGESQRKEKADAAKRAEAQRAARVKNVVNKIALILSEGDSLTVLLKNLTVTPDERKQLASAFDALGNRVAQNERQWQSAENSARYMTQRLVLLGAPPEEIKEAIEHLKREAETAAMFALSQREGKKLVAKQGK